MDPSPHRAISAEAFADLRRLLEQAVVRVCPPWLANERDDLVQASCLRLLKLVNKKGAPGEFTPAYLRRVAYSHLVDEIRRRRRRRETPLETEDGPPRHAAGEAGPERRTLASELRQAIRECLDLMIPPRRRAVTLCLLGHGNLEVARLMGWDAKRAENLVTRGRADLRECLRGRGLER